MYLGVVLYNKGAWKERALKDRLPNSALERERERDVKCEHGVKDT